MKKVLAVGVMVSALAGCTSGGKCSADVVFLGGTGTGLIPTSHAVSGTFTKPFGYKPIGESLVYDGAPWANPHTSVPLVLAAIADDNNKNTVVIGLSKGSQLAMATEARDTDPTTAYVYVANPDGAHGISRSFGLSAAWHEPTHNVTSIYAEYDGVADWPTNPLNLLADANALAGWLYIHPNYGAGTAADPLTRIDEGITETESNENGTVTTTIRIPTHDLPITTPLRQLGVDTTGIDRALRPVIDAGYNRTPKAQRHTVSQSHHDNIKSHKSGKGHSK